jgi:hypothetical protein
MESLAATLLGLTATLFMLSARQIIFGNVALPVK